VTKEIGKLRAVNLSTVRGAEPTCARYLTAKRNVMTRARDAAQDCVTMVASDIPIAMERISIFQTRVSCSLQIPQQETCIDRRNAAHLEAICGNSGVFLAINCISRRRYVLGGITYHEMLTSLANGSHKINALQSTVLSFIRMSERERERGGGGERNWRAGVEIKIRFGNSWQRVRANIGI